MKLNLKIALAFAIAALLAVDARAQNAKLDLVGTPVLISISTNNLTVGTAGAGDLILSSNDTERARLDGTTGDLIWASGKGARHPAATVMTPGANPTPVATLGAGVLSSVAAAAPTANFLPLPAATANVGRTLKLLNPAANPVAILAATSGDTLNAGAQWTPFACPAGAECSCTAYSSTAWGCSN